MVQRRSASRSQTYRVVTYWHGPDFGMVLHRLNELFTSTHPGVYHPSLSLEVPGSDQVRAETPVIVTPIYPVTARGIGLVVWWEQGSGICALSSGQVEERVAGL